MVFVELNEGKEHMQKIDSYGGIKWLVAAFALIGLLAGCNGNTDGGDQANIDFSDGEFIDSDANTGSITLSVDQTTLPVAGTSSFGVSVKNSSGEPVPQLTITCDTEQGLAIIEPTSGSEITDQYGGISGFIGCAAPGSYQMACRLPIGANKRKFQTIHCTGSIPAGFSGFAGAAGGGLGGGTGGSSGDDGSNGSSSVRINSIEFLDAGETSADAAGTTSIDVDQGLCGTDCAGAGAASCTAEPFFDTYIKITVRNNSNQNVRFRSYRYSIPEATGTGTATFTSESIAFISDAEISADGGETTFVALFLDAIDPGDKAFHGSSSAISDDLGFRNISVTLSGTNDAGETVTVTGRNAASFDNFNNCSS